MEIIKTVAENFLLALAFGTHAFTFVANPRLTGAGFIRLCTGVCAGSTLVAFLIYLSQVTVYDQLPTYMYPILLSLFLQVYLFHPDKKTPLMWAYYGLQLLCFLFLGFWSAGKNLETFGFFALTAGTIGVVNYAMVLGHYYLVVPKLSERPLVICMLFFWPIIALKIAWSVYNYLQNPDFFISGTTLGGGYIFNWIMLLMRAGWGYLVMLILSYFSWRLIRMRSIQSATGVLYVMTFFVIVGELIAIYLHFNYGLYL